jgi:hypothetical protein
MARTETPEEIREYARDFADQDPAAAAIYFGELGRALYGFMPAAVAA